MMLDAPLDVDRFARVVRRRVIDRYPVFRQRPIASRLPGALPHWEDDDDFGLDRHLHHAVLPAPGDDAALQEYVGGFLATPAAAGPPALGHPPRRGPTAEGSAIYVRLHHALADGIALTQVLLSLTDATADAADDGSDGGAGRDTTVSATSSRRAAACRPRGDRRAATRAGPGGVVAAVRTGVSGAGVLSKLLLTRNPDIAARRRGRDAQAGGLVRPDRPAAGQGHRQAPPDATVNDVLVAALAGALAALPGRARRPARSTCRRWSRSTCARSHLPLPARARQPVRAGRPAAALRADHRRRAARRDQAPDGPDQALRRSR